MNRAERRRKEKAEGKVYALTGHDLAYRQGYAEGIQDAAYERVANTVRVFTTAMMATLYNECGYGKKRMLRVMEHFSATANRMYYDRTVEPKLRQYVIDKTGVNPDDWTGCRKLDVIGEIREQRGMAPIMSKQDAAAIAEMVGKEIEGWE